MACSPSKVARECSREARACVCRDREPCCVCSRMRIEVSRTDLWSESREVRLLVSSVWAASSSWGRSSVAVFTTSFAVVDREAASKADRGAAMVQRWLVMVSNCVEMAEAMMSILSRNMVTSPERISRSAGSGIWPASRVATKSTQACNSSGKVGAREGRVVRVLMRICVDNRTERAVVRFWSLVSVKFQAHGSGT